MMNDDSRRFGCGDLQSPVVPPPAGANLQFVPCFSGQTIAFAEPSQQRKDQTGSSVGATFL